MNTASLIRTIALASVAVAVAARADGAELKLLSQGLPAASYTGGDAKAFKDAEPEKAFDGRTHGDKTAWCNGSSYPVWLEADLGSECRVIKTMLYMERPNVWYAYKIEVSEDNKTWTSFADQSQNKEASDDPAFTDMGGATGRYVRITLLDAPERNRNPPWFWPVVEEFQVYGLPLAPPPGTATGAAAATAAAPKQ
jgi:hypothetical protein